MPKDPQIETNQPQISRKINWKKVLIGVLVGILLIGGGVGAWLLLGNPNASPPSQTPSSTPSAETATPSAQVDETAGWKTFSGPQGDLDIPKHSFKYPPSLKVAQQPGLNLKGVTTKVKNQLLNNKETGVVEFAQDWDTPGYLQAIVTGSGYYSNYVGNEKDNNQTVRLLEKNDTTLGGKTATRALFSFAGIDNLRALEYYTEFDGKIRKVTLQCLYVVTAEENLENQCDLIASTFKFLD